MLAIGYDLIKTKSPYYFKLGSNSSKARPIYEHEYWSNEKALEHQTQMIAYLNDYYGQQIAGIVNSA